MDLEVGGNLNQTSNSNTTALLRVTVGGELVQPECAEHEEDQATVLRNS